MDTYTLVIIIALLLLLLGILIIFNGIVKSNNFVKEAFATMDVYLKKRWDLIPNIVEVVKSYAEYEKDTIEEVINLRNKNYEDLSLNEKLQTNETVTKDINKILMLKEAYPELKANQNFLDLSNQLVQVEDDIANARKYFNACVRELNNKIEMFPSNIVAKIFRFKSMQMFEATDEERKNKAIKI